MLAGCGTEPTPFPTLSAPSGTPSTSSTPAASAAAPRTYTLSIPSLSLTLRMTPIDCLGGQDAAPLADAVLFVDCGTFVAILGARGGPLALLAGTTASLTWVNAGGTTVTGALDGTTVTLARSPSGAYTGHGAAARAFFVQLRGAADALELAGRTT